MSSPLHRLRSALAADFEFERVLVSGGFGVLRLARERALNRLVVIKTMRDDQQSPAIATRFLREAELLARLNDSRVVRVYRAGEVAGMPYCVLEHLDGPNLAQRLARGPLGRRELRRLGRDILGGLAVMRGDRSRCPMVERVAQLWSRADHPARLQPIVEPLAKQCQ